MEIIGSFIRAYFVVKLFDVHLSSKQYERN